MNLKTLIIVLVNLFLVSPAFCQDFLVARVLEVFPEKQLLTVASIDNPAEHFTVRIAEENDLPVRGGEIAFPECVVKGATIRLWGITEQTDPPLFIAADIRGCRHGGCTDPTGVRSRLRKIRNEGYGISDEGNSRSDYGGYEGHGRGGQGSGGGNGGGGGGNR